MDSVVDDDTQKMIARAVEEATQYRQSGQLPDENAEDLTFVMSEEQVIAQAQPGGQTQPVVKTETSGEAQDDNAQEWEKMDLGKSIAEAENKQLEEVQAFVASMPEMPDETAPEDDGHVNFVELNKTVRKTFKAGLKAKGVSITVRAPGRPVIIDIDEISLTKLIEDIFSKIGSFAKEGEKVYAEVYEKEHQVIYIVKIPVAEEQMEEAKEAAETGTFDAARKIAEANGGRFIVTLDGTTLKVGMLIDAA